MEIELAQLALTPGGRTPEDVKVVLPFSPYHDVRALLADAARREGDPPRAAFLCLKAIRDHWVEVSKRRNVLSPQACDLVDMQKQCLRSVHQAVRQGIDGPPAALAFGDFAVHGEIGLFLQAGDISLYVATREGLLVDLSARHSDEAGRLLVHVGFTPEEPRFAQTSFTITQEMVFLLTSDGLAKAVGKARLTTLMCQAYQTGVADTVEDLRQLLIHDGFEDDITCVMVKATPALPLRPRKRISRKRHVWGRMPWASRKEEVL